ncbi:hypothetical protein TIFTF001_012325 [Ficus carica]|uniref:Uncharacterized protein n=1 Tax=Ficus carica TaxID=3494 RepID=A0AA88D552_FICCA|nr:hypothetical protein TIFTF001_012325 [Ficus carica]
MESPVMPVGPENSVWTSEHTSASWFSGSDQLDRDRPVWKTRSGPVSTQVLTGFPDRPDRGTGPEIPIRTSEHLWSLVFKTDLTGTGRALVGCAGAGHARWLVAGALGWRRARAGLPSDLVRTSEQKMLAGFLDWPDRDNRSRKPGQAGPEIPVRTSEHKCSLDFRTDLTGPVRKSRSGPASMDFRTGLTGTGHVGPEILVRTSEHLFSLDFQTGLTGTGQTGLEIPIRTSEHKCSLFFWTGRAREKDLGGRNIQIFEVLTELSSARAP